MKINKALFTRSTAISLLTPCFSAGLSAILLLLFMRPVGAAESQVLRGHVPAVVSRLQPVERLAGGRRLDLAIGLPLRNAAGLSALLQQLNDPASPNYHQWLTPEQFTERFGPTEADYQAVAAWAKAHGLAMTATHPNRVVLDVEGSVGNIEQALHLALRVYPHPTEARTFYAPDAEPSLDLAVPVASISGLDTYSLPRPMHRVSSLDQTANAVPRSGSGPGGAYAAGDFRAAYVPGTALTGMGQSVGLLQFDGYYASDIAAYRTQFGLPSIPLVNVPVDGGVTTPGSGNAEVCLDIEMVMSMAPEITAIYVFQAPNPSPWEDLLNAMVTNIAIKQFSCSWGGGTPTTTAEAIFQQMAAQGQSFFNASGDSDAFCSAAGSIAFPSESTNITQVGGTTLTTTGAGGGYMSETVWNWGGGTGSSGGISTKYPIPIWQQGISMTANHGSTTMRNIPDVALTADNVYVTYNNGSSGSFGGTSCAAPLWAGFTALINQQAVASSVPTVGFLNPAVYNIGKGALYASTFHDTITGNNTNATCGPTMFPAGAGYDLATGWGTPLGQALIDALVPPDALQISPAVGFASSGGLGGPFTMSSLSLTLTNRGTNSFMWSLVNTSLWLNVSSGGGTLTPGGPATTVAVSLNSVASNLAVGSYSAVIRFTNLSSNIGQGREFDLAVISPPTIVAQPTNQTILDGATATFTVGVNGGQPLTYQWQANSNNLSEGGHIFGSATATLTVSNVGPANAASYRAIVTNAAGMAVSSNAVLVALPGNVDHFVWSTISATQVFNAPFTASITALDPAEVTATNFTGTVALGGWTQGSANASPVVIAEVDTGDNDAVEFANVSGLAVDVSGWQITTYDWNSWPGPGLTFTVPSGTICPAGGVFLLREMGTPPGSYPVFYTGVNIYWNNNSSGNQVALLLRDNTGYIMDFFCAVDANPASITLPTNIPSAQWLGAPVPANLNSSLTYQRVGNQDRNTNADWVVGTPSLGLLNTNLNLPFVGGPTPVAITPINSGNFVNGVWSGNIAVFQAATNIILAANDAGGHYGSSNPFSVIYSNQPPLITLQPTNQTLPAGYAATFTLGALGSPPLSYYWSRNGTLISGATSASYSTNDVQVSDSGSQFSCVVSNAYGTTNSQVATLTVLALPPTITQQPLNRTASVGGGSTFSVTATGSLPLSYSWQCNGAAIAGATLSSYTTNNLPLSASGSQFSCMVSNSFGTTNSSIALLSVVTAPTDWFTELFGTTITNIMAFKSFTFTPDASANFYAVCSGPALAFLTDPTGGTLLSEGDDTYASIAISGGNTVAIYTNRTNVIYVGSNGYLTMNSGDTSYSPSYSSHFSSPRVSALYRDLNPGSGGTVSWKQLTDHIAVTYQAVPIYGSSTQTNSFQVEMFFDGRIRITYLSLNTPTGLVGLSAGMGQPTNFVASDFTTYTSCGPQPPVIVAQPSNQTVPVGGTACFSLGANGSTPLYYFWQRNGATIAGATQSSYCTNSVQLADSDSLFSCLVSNAYGTTLSSNGMLKVLNSSGIVAYFTDNNATDVGPQAPITMAGFSPLHISDISTQILAGFQILFIDENNNTSVSSPLLARLADIQGWVNGGGKLIVHDRSAGNISPNPFLLGVPGSITVRSTTSDIDVIPPGTNLVVAGPFGTINNTTLDGGASSAHGYVTQSQLPASAYPILSMGGAPTNVIAFSYPLGSGEIYYSSIPLDCYLAGDACAGNIIAAALQNIYTPNVLIYAAAFNACSNCPPAIVTQPVSQTVAAGSSVTFSVGATGGAPLSYFWNLNGAFIVGATASNFTTNNVPLAANGSQFSCVVTNAYGATSSQVATLTVVQAANDWFTELFGTTITNIMAFKSFTFTPDGSANFYAVCSGPALAFPTEPTGGFQLTEGDDTDAPITVSGGNTVAIYTNRTNVIYVGSNGYLTMNSGDTSYSPSYTTHFSLPRVSALYRDLNPGSGGTVSWKQLTDRVAVTYQAVPIFGSSTQTNSFQVELFFDGRIRLTYLSLNTPSGLVGLSAGSGQPTNFVASDFTAYTNLCAPQPPAISAQPTNQTVPSGTSANFTIGAWGTPPLNYSWLLNGAPIPGATNASYTTNSVPLSASGSKFRCVVTNAYGTTNSQVAALTVLPPSVDHFAWSTIASPEVAGTPFPVTISARDQFGVVVSSFNGAASISAAGSGPTEYLHVDFESGLQGFTIDNTYGSSNGLWHASTGRGLNPGHSATHSLYYGQHEGPDGGGDYNVTNFANGGVVVSAPFGLPSGAGPLTLSFNYLIAVESGITYDQAYVEISTNNGASYQAVASKNLLGGLTNATGGLWVSNTVSLASYAGSTIRLRFRFDTVDSISNSTEGWYLDDIVIRSDGAANPIPVTPTNVVFVSGIWAGNVTVLQPATNASLTASDGAGHTGWSNPFQVVSNGVAPVTPTWVVEWGANDYGQGDIPWDLTDAVAISAGFYHSLALKADGTVVGWGNDASGEADPPVGLSNVTAIAAGWGTSLALRRDGTVEEWGWDGGYGLKTTAESLSNITAIAACWDCLMALKGDGTVTVWGHSTHGETNVLVGLTDVAAVSGGGYFCMALKRDGTVVTWGSNVFGQTNTPTNLNGVKAIAAGGDHCLALKSDGTVVSWGYNYYGQTSVPSDLTNGVAVSAGAYHSLALRADGTVAAWGWGSSGQTNIPPCLHGITAISAGGYHNLALVAGLYPMQLSSVNYLPGGRLQFTVSGVAGDVYHVLVSTNLHDWQTNASITNLSGTMQFTDPDAAGYSRRFYRLVMP
jgi:hypothetical protein